MDKNTLIKILQEKSMSFTEEEVRALVNDELEKDPSEMDTQLIDYCVNLLLENEGKDATDNSCSIKETKQKTKKIKFSKTLLLIAILIIIMAIAIPTGAKFVQINAKDDMVKYEKDHFSIELDGSEKSVDNIIAALESEGVENAVLPKALLGDDYEIYHIKSENEKRYYFENKASEIYGDIVIFYSENDFDSLIGKSQTSSIYSHVEQLKINGIDVLLFEENDYVLLVYLNNNIEYIVMLESCSFEKAKDIAYTLGE